MVCAAVNTLFVAQGDDGIEAFAKASARQGRQCRRQNAASARQARGVRKKLKRVRRTGN